MRLRLGFVSNSSSSSFVIPLQYVTEKQLHEIKNHLDIVKLFVSNPELYPNCWKGYEECEYDKEDAWEVNVSDNNVSGSTDMDSFDMYSFLASIGIDMSKVKFGR